MFEKARTAIATMGAAPACRRAILIFLWLASVAGAVYLTAYLMLGSPDDTPGELADGSYVIERVEESVVTYQYSNGLTIRETSHSVRTLDDPAVPGTEA